MSPSGKVSLVFAEGELTLNWVNHQHLLEAKLTQMSHSPVLLRHTFELTSRVTGKTNKRYEHTNEIQIKKEILPAGQHCLV